MSDAFKPRTMKRKNVKGLALNAPATAPEPSAGDAQIPGGIGNSVGSMDTLEIGVEFQLDLKTDEFEMLKELGAGNGGTVSKVMHPATKIVMARKIIHVEAKEAVRKNIVRELHIMKDCSSPHIVTFYGAFLSDTGDVIMCMEYMDAGSLDRISKDFGPIRVDVLGKIAVAILGGLIYLYETYRIMHRDIKPSNVLVNSRGQIKLCDFGVSGELVNSVADTFVGTSTYMAPERIQGAKYTIKSDVWSFGLTIMELAIARFPFDSSDAQGGKDVGMGGILDLLQQIVHEPPPRLPKSSAFPPILDEMIQACLSNNADTRPAPRELFDNDLFVQAAKRTPVDLEAWAVEMMQRNNRKSHLAAPISPGTQALLRSEGPFAGGHSPLRETAPAQTPTSGEIPIAASAGTSAQSHYPNDGQPTPRQTPQQATHDQYAQLPQPQHTPQHTPSYQQDQQGSQPQPQQHQQDPFVHRVVPAENGSAPPGSAGSYSAGGAGSYGAGGAERPGYPPRTSSSTGPAGQDRNPSPLPLHSNPASQPMTMPIRPAPLASGPPSAPLPHPPPSAGRDSAKRFTPAAPFEDQR